MPEIKEVRKFADFIKKNIKNKKIIEIKILAGRYKKHEPFKNYNIIKKKLPLKVIDVKTRGKFLYIIFEKNFYLFSTLGLTGGWCYLKKNNNKIKFSKNLNDYSKFLSKEKIDSYINNSINHLNVEFKTKDGSLYYYDMLSFGSLKIVNNIEELNKKLNSLGPDIMDDKTDYILFKNQITKIKNLNKSIGIVLVDQKIVSGIGNYLRSEILYISKINPFKKIKKLNENDIKIIYNNSKILTWYDYDMSKAKKLNIIKNIKLPSDYNRTFFVYNEKEDIYGNKIIKKELYTGNHKRYIYYVPKIQI